MTMRIQTVSKPISRVSPVLLRFAPLVLLVLVVTQSQPAAAQPAFHPVIGTWSWSGFAGKCVETWQYRNDGVMLATSGEAVTEWRYSITPQTGASGFYRLAQTSVRQNGKKDCAGDVVDEAGTLATVFLQINPARDRHIVCKNESLAECFGPLSRVQ
jgi:hypothetical protein